MDDKYIYGSQNVNQMFGKMDLEQTIRQSIELSEGKEIAKNYSLTRKYVRLMEELLTISDHEQSHRDADDLLCNLLRELGFDAVVDVYARVGKWYE